MRATCTTQHSKKAQFDEYELIVLRQVEERRHALREFHNALNGGSDARGELRPQHELRVL